jgi:uncharacterized repeat protein (TIGR03803 family)
MTIPRSAPAHVLFIACGVAITACSQAGEVSRLQYLPTATTLSAAGPEARSYRVLHSFENGQTDADGAYPQASLIEVNGTLFGTTSLGGSVADGAIFGIPDGGLETTVFSFGSINTNDGSDPLAGLIDVNGTLYGTTNSGGAKGEGTAFSFVPGGGEKLLYSFAGGSDGANPAAPLVDVNGTLYGTTTRGGTSGLGTVFSLTLHGKEKILHSFRGGSDGSSPFSSLIDVNGALYGTTSSGGKIDAGTVFSITTGGKEKVLYSFVSASDGDEPFAGLVAVNGTLYGTTYSGGVIGGGIGTIFSITTSGKEKILYRFRGSDGKFPMAPLLAVKDTFYGTTTEGGANGEGTVFSFTLSGKEKVLHSFGKGKDGTDPDAGVIAIKGKLYGTTDTGGSLGLGTVYALTY